MGKSDKVKKEIINTTIELLRNKGTASIKEIAALADVNIAAINYHFGDKINLVNKVINIIFNEKIAMVKNLIENKKCDSKEEAAKMFCELTIAFIEENFGVIKYIIADDLISENDNNPTIYTLHQKYLEIYAQAKTVLIDILGNDVTEEQLRAKFAILFSAYLMPLIFQLNASTINDGLAVNRNAIISEMVSLILNKKFY
ncbi:MAG: TetR/AcrR family transcriptional regulator [Clostridia bacterium]